MLKSQQQEQQNRKPNAALLEAKRKAKELNKGIISSDTVIIKDIYQSAMDSLKIVRGDTGLVYDNRMSQHRCLWDPKFPECPERFTRVMERYLLHFL